MRNLSKLAIEALFSLTNFECKSIKVTSRKLSNGKRVASLYAYDTNIATYYRDSNSITIGIPTTKPMVVALSTRLLSFIPGVNAKEEGGVITLGGAPWDMRRTLITT